MPACFLLLNASLCTDQNLSFNWFFFLLNFDILLFFFFFFGKKIKHSGHFCNIVLEGVFGISEIRFLSSFSLSEMYRELHF